jgi:hypothetical protein
LLPYAIAMQVGRRRREDRLSKLSDATLGRILSFLPAKEAGRASALSSRWRNVYAGVDAVTLEQPESPIPEQPTAPAPPLRVLRVALNHYRREDGGERGAEQRRGRRGRGA